MMALGSSVYWVTFGIANDGHFAIYHDRLKKAVAALAEGKVWTEPTSFCLFRSRHGIDAVAGSLAKAIRSDRDFVVIGMPYRQEGRVLGNWGDDRLQQLMPFAQFV